MRVLNLLILINTYVIEKKTYWMSKTLGDYETSISFLFRSSLPYPYAIFFRLAHLALQNVNKDYVVFLYFRNFVAKGGQKPKMG